MGASSVTGVSGVGAVKGMKGPGNDRNYWDANVGPHILAAGVATLEELDQNLLAGNIVILPEALEKDADNYVVIVTAITDGLVDLSVPIKFGTNGHFAAFVVVSGDSRVAGTIYYMVVNKGYGMEVVLPDGR